VRSAEANAGALSGLQVVVSQPTIHVGGLADVQVPIIATAPKSSGSGENVRLTFTVSSSSRR
jgi:hypothetical protein